METRDLRQYATASICSVLAILTFFWNLPNNPGTRVLHRVSESVMRPLGLAQNWKMFAGDTRLAPTTFIMRVRLYLENGTSWDPPEFQLWQPTFSRTPIRGVELNALRFWGSENYLHSFLNYFCSLKVDGQRPARVASQTIQFPTLNLSYDPLVHYWTHNPIISRPFSAAPEWTFQDERVHQCVK